MGEPTCPSTMTYPRRLLATPASRQQGHLSLSNVVGWRHLEVATRSLATVATLVDRHARNLGYQSFGHATYFGVIRRYGGQGTAVAPNDEGAILLFQLSKTAQLIEHAGSHL